MSVTYEHHYGTTLPVKGNYINWCDSCYHRLFPDANKTRSECQITKNTFEVRLIKFLTKKFTIYCAFLKYCDK
jgi:hypothetical protein